jgi:hypothetical protein
MFPKLLDVIALIAKCTVPLGIPGTPLLMLFVIKSTVKASMPVATLYFYHSVFARKIEIYTAAANRLLALVGDAILVKDGGKDVFERTTYSWPTVRASASMRYTIINDSFPLMRRIPSAAPRNQKVASRPHLVRRQISVVRRVPFQSEIRIECLEGCF